MNDDRQYAPATLRDGDFILDVLPMADVILEIASGKASLSSMPREIPGSSATPMWRN
jgi:hypothetical protein